MNVRPGRPHHKNDPCVSVVRIGWSGESGVAFEEELEQAIGLDRRAQAPQDLLVRRLVGHIILEKNENTLAQTFLVHFAVKLSTVNGFAVETNELIWAHIGFREFDPARAELTDPVIVPQLNVESLGKISQQWICNTGRREADGEGADFRFLHVLDDGSAAEICKELMTPTGTKNGAAVIDETLNDLAQRWAEWMFPGYRKGTGSADQDGVSVLDIAPTDLRVVDEIDELKLPPSDAAAIDEAALLLLEGYQLVPDLEEHESKLGSRCRHLIL